MGDIAQRGNRLTFAKGGRAGHSLGHTAGRRLTKTLERLGGGPEGKPHSTRAGRIAAGVRKIKRGAKSWNKKDFKGSDEVRALLKGLRPKKPSTHGKDIPTMAAQGGRAGKLAGGVIKKVIQGGKKISKKISDAARKQDTADRIKIFEQAGPHEGEVITKRILGKGTKKGDRTKAAVKDAVAAKPWAGKPHAEGGRIGRAAGGWTKVIPRTLKKLDFPGDRTGKPHSSREGRRDSWVRGARRAVESAKKIKEKMKPKRRGWEKLPQSKWKKPIDKFPGDPKKYTKPIDKFPGDPKKWQPMKEGGRTGLKKGGPKPGTHDYFLLHKREKKAGGGTLLKQTVKKVAKKIKAKKDTESVKDVR